MQLGGPPLLLLHLLQPRQQLRVLLPSPLVCLCNLLLQPGLQRRCRCGVGGVGVLQLLLELGLPGRPCGIILLQLLGKLLSLHCLSVHCHLVLLIQFSRHFTVPILQLRFLMFISLDGSSVLLLHLRQLPLQILLLRNVTRGSRRVVTARLPVERRLLPLFESGRGGRARVVGSLHGGVLKLPGGRLHLLGHPHTVGATPNPDLPRLLQIQIRHPVELLRLPLLLPILFLHLRRRQPALLLLLLVVLLFLLSRLLQLVLRYPLLKMAVHHHHQHLIETLHVAENSPLGLDPLLLACVLHDRLLGRGQLAAFDPRD
mmetsp:Transcript_114626/g.263086  ORF Transcript_114626/g.263086 Transcript_114626/m.263086 type:complete len:315 (-) Transcript_114626:930-1874(-)